MVNWRDIFFRENVNMTAGLLETDQTPDKLQPTTIEAEKSYINIVLRSMRIRNVRVGLKKFYGVVNSFIKLPALETEDASFNVVTIPSQLKNIDSAKLDLVIQMDQRLLGPVPYRGGDVHIELGLFSVKTVDLVDVYLGLLGEIADAAGVSYIRQAVPFVKPIDKGIQMLLGAGATTNLEVGLKRDAFEPKTGHYVVTNAPKTEIKLSELALDKDYQPVLKDGKEFKKYSYMVFTIYTTPDRKDWYDIPEIGIAHQNLRAAIRTAKKEAISEFYETFKRTTLTSPDLLLEDASDIAKKVYKLQVEPWLKPAEEVSKEDKIKETAMTLRKLDQVKVDL